jgi:hypothetical protein
MGDIHDLSVLQVNESSYHCLDGLQFVLCLVLSLMELLSEAPNCLHDLVLQATRNLYSVIREGSSHALFLLTHTNVTSILASHLSLYQLRLRENFLGRHSTPPLSKHLLSITLGNVEVGVPVEPPPVLPLLSAFLDFFSVGMDIFAVGEGSLLHLIFVLPIVESVASTKLELKLFILHRWSWYLTPSEANYLLNDSDLDHSLVPHLEDSIFPGLAGLLLTKVINDHEEGSEQAPKLILIEVPTLLANLLHYFLVLFQRRGVDVVTIIRPSPLLERVEVDLLFFFLAPLRGVVILVGGGVAPLKLSSSS